MERVQIAVIGAGVIGLAIARELALLYNDVAVLEAHESYGRETSSRSSEVIHVGIYYPPGSQKASLCAEGSRLIYEYCLKRSVPHRKIGKLIVAKDSSESGRLEALLLNAAQNSVNSLSMLDGRETKKLEPSVMAAGAIYSPSTGILDTHAFMKSLYHDALSSGAVFSFGSRVTGISVGSGGYEINLAGADCILSSRVVINAAGLYSDKVSGLAGIHDESYSLRYLKGSYFAYHKPSPVGMLVYPLPNTDHSGLGIHATLDMGGRLRFGPDSEEVQGINYHLDSNKRELFLRSASSYINGLDIDAFEPDTSGIRPALKGSGFHDFIIREESDKGFAGFINLIAIDSPGITASLAISRQVAKIARECLQ